MAPCDVEVAVGVCGARAPRGEGLYAPHSPRMVPCSGEEWEWTVNFSTLPRFLRRPFRHSHEAEALTFQRLNFCLGFCAKNMPPTSMSNIKYHCIYLNIVY